MKWFIPFAIALLASLPLSATADPPEGKGDKAHKHHDEGDDSDRERGDEGDHDRDRHRSGRKERDERRAFRDDEREAINSYYGRHRYGGEEEEGEHHRGRGDDLPPGWERKLHRGERIPDDVWAHRAPLPPEIVVRLPPPPGVALVRIHDHVVRVIERTHEVLDDLGIPHPPTPR